MSDEARRLKDSVNLVEVVGRYVALKQEGRDWVACCPFHSEKTPSFKVNEPNQFYKCFGCGESGDVYDFLQKHLSLSFRESVELLGGKSSATGTPQEPAPALKQMPPDDLRIMLFDSRPPATHPKLGKPTRHWDYCDAKGAAYARVFRFEGGGKKQFSQMCRVNTGSRYSVWDSNKRESRLIEITKPTYVWKAPPADQRHLYNLHLLKDAKLVVVCEGEKAADAATQIYGDAGGVGTCWLGGSKAVGRTDMERVLPKKPLLLWADWDEGGLDAMQEVAAAAAKRKLAVRWVIPPPGSPDGWDAADALAEGLTDKTLTFAASPPVLPVRKTKPKTQPTPSPKSKKPPAAPKEQQKAAPAKPSGGTLLPSTVVPLGIDSSNVYLWDATRATVVSPKATAGAVNAVLLALAPHSFWEARFKKENSWRISWTEAVSVVFAECKKKGKFSPDVVRGRGVSIDADRAVLNTGKTLITETGERHDIFQQGVEFDYFYSISDAPSQFDLPAGTKPAGTEEMQRLVDIISRMVWYREEDAAFLFGWMAMSVVSGVLEWRPHIWLSGASGSGKSWVLENIVQACLGRYPILVDNNTSEASLRREANNDTRPIVFDEFESKTKEQVRNTAAVVSLARSACTARGARITKASSGSDVDSYTIRSSFFFSSITMPLQEAADTSRFVNIALRRQGLSNEDFDQLCRDTTALIGEDFAHRFVMRAFLKARQIKAAAPVFVRALRRHIGDQRLSDTRGAMLSAAWCMLRRDSAAPTDDDAEAFFEAYRIILNRDEVVDIVLDDAHVLGVLGATRITIDSGQTFGGSGRKITIGEAVSECLLPVGTDEDEKNRKLVQSELRRYSIDVERGDTPEVLIGNNSALARVFSDTAWSLSWFEVMKQRPEIQVVKKSRRFGANVHSVWLRVPAHTFFNEPQEAQ